MADEKRKKRNVAVEKRISDLNEDDSRVKIVGKVVKKDDSNNSIVLKHNSEITVLLDKKNFQKVEKDKIFKVIGVIVPPLDEGEKVELKGEVVQNFSGLDLELYEKYLKLRNIKSL